MRWREFLARDVKRFALHFTSLQMRLSQRLEIILSQTWSDIASMMNKQLGLLSSRWQQPAGCSLHHFWVTRRKKSLSTINLAMRSEKRACKLTFIRDNESLFGKSASDSSLLQQLSCFSPFFDREVVQVSFRRVRCLCSTPIHLSFRWHNTVRCSSYALCLHFFITNLCFLHASTLLHSSGCQHRL